jgi:hypothetical protein
MADLNELTTFIVFLSENPAQARLFKEDPVSVINQSELSEDTKTLLLSDPAVFMRRVLAGPQAGAVTRPNITTHIQTNVNTHTNTTTHVNVNTNNQTTTFVAVFVLAQ